MALSIYLAEVFGWYLAIIGFIFLWKRGQLMGAVQDMASRRSLVMVVSIVELLAGLFLVVKHNLWVADYRLVITLIAWAAIIEGAAYLIMSPKDFSRWVKSFNKPNWYTGSGLIALILGIYLLIQVY